MSRDAMDYDEQWRAEFRARVLASVPVPTIYYVREKIADALYESVTMGTEIIVKVLPPTHHGVESVLIEFVSVRGEPINPSRWYRLKRAFRKWRPCR